MHGESMIGFGSKQAWLAVRDADPAEVIGALGLRDLGPVDWRVGVDLGYLTDDRLVLTPPLSGAHHAHWLLGFGRWLLSRTVRVDVAGLSATLATEVQSFATYRTLELHRWQRAVNGTLVRSFEYVGTSGEVTDWQGDPDDAERSVGIPAALGPDVTVLVSEHDVMRLAAQWSVDPTALDGQPAPGPLRATAVP